MFEFEFEFDNFARKRTQSFVPISSNSWTILSMVSFFILTTKGTGAYAKILVPAARYKLLLGQLLVTQIHFPFAFHFK